MIPRQLTLRLPARLLPARPPAGIVSVAVVLKHAAIFPEHEQQVGRLAREMGFQQVRGTTLCRRSGANSPQQNPAHPQPQNQQHKHKHWRSYCLKPLK